MKRILVAAALVCVAADARAAASCHLDYGNGALIPNVSIVALYWGTTNNGQYAYKDQLHQYYDAITNSPYFDWLIEYNVTGYSVGRGGFTAEYADPAPPAGTTIDETKTLTPWISGLIDAGKIPAPDDNTLYFVHLPGTVQVSGGGAGTTCSDNCAYHSFYEKSGKEVRFAVIPDQNSGACSTNSICPTELAALPRLTIVASHELVEAVTDPNGSGWLDNNQQCGEIGDICVGQPGTAAGYTVQLEWSNKNAKCIDHDANVVFNDFSLALTPATASAAAGTTATVSVAAMPTTGSQPETVALTVDGLPTGVTGAFATASIESNASTMLTLTVAGTMAPGSYMFDVTGKATNGAHHSASGMLTVTEAPPPPSGGVDGNGGGGSSGGVGGSGSGGNGATGNGGATGGGRASGGCAVDSVGAAPSADVVLFALAGLVLLILRRLSRQHPPTS
ncbi:MAG TPA: hypothetical protein VGL86_32750 [Polyangia bacterium]|jgi:MYXO-CTERM domain-containing protein